MGGWPCLNLGKVRNILHFSFRRLRLVSLLALYDLDPAIILLGFLQLLAALLRKAQLFHACLFLNLNYSLVVIVSILIVDHAVPLLQLPFIKRFAAILL